MAKQKIKQFWFVCKLAVTADPNKPAINFEPAQAEVARPAPARNRLRMPDQVAPGGFAAVDMNQLERAQPPEQPQIGEPEAGYGYYLQSADAKELNKVFTTEGAAIKFAQQCAEEKPTTTFGVFGCLRVYETTVPSLIEKAFTVDGELRLIGG